MDFTKTRLYWANVGTNSYDARRIANLGRDTAQETRKTRATFGTLIRRNPAIRGNSEMNTCNL